MSANKIMHFGPGHFFMGHFATYTQDLNNKGYNYQIDAVSVRSKETRDALREQGHKYTVTEHSKNNYNIREIDCVKNIYAASDAEDHETIEQLLKKGDYNIFSLTITQGGYYYKNGGLIKDNPVINECVHAKETKDIKSALGFITEGLYWQYKQGIDPAVVLSLDNMSQNGDILRAVTLSYANEAVESGRYEQDKGFVQWMGEKVSFPNTMVDRIVPEPNEEHKAFLREKGYNDAIGPKTEVHRQLVVETDGKDLPESVMNFSKAGVQFVEDAKPYERVKIRVLNGTHMFIGPVADLALSEMGIPAEKRTVDCAMDVTELEMAALQFMIDTSATLNVPSLTIGDNENATVGDYIDVTMARLQNTSMSDSLNRLGRNATTQKLAERNVQPAVELMHLGQPYDFHLMGLAAWTVYVSGVNYAHETINAQDPKALEMGLDQDARDVIEGKQSSAQLISKMNKLNLLGDAGRELEMNTEAMKKMDEMVHNIATMGILDTIRKKLNTSMARTIGNPDVV